MHAAARPGAGRWSMCSRRRATAARRRGGPLALRSAYGPVPRPQDYPVARRGRGARDDRAPLRRVLPQAREESRERATPRRPSGGPAARPARPARRHRGVCRDGQDVHARAPRRRAGPLGRRDDRPAPLRDVHREGDPRDPRRACGRKLEDAPRRAAASRRAKRRSAPGTSGRSTTRATQEAGGRARTPSTARPSRRSTPSASASSARTRSRAGGCFEERQVDGREAFGRAFRDALRRRRRARPGARAVARGRAAGRLVHRAHRGPAVELRAERAASCDRSSTRRRSTRRSRRSPCEDAREPTEPRRAARRGGCTRRTASTIVGALVGPRATSSERARADARRARRSCARRRTSLALAAREAAGALAAAGPRRRASSPRRWSSRGRRRRSPPPSRSAARRRAARARAAQAGGGQYDFDDMLALVDEALRGPRGAALAAAMRRALALRAHRRVPGHRRDAVVDLPPRVLRARTRAGTPASSICRRGPEAVDLPLPRRRRGDVPARRATRCSRRAARASPRRQLPRDAARSSTRTNRFFDRTAREPFFTGDIALRAGRVRAPGSLARRRRRATAVTPVHAFRFEGALSLADAGRADRARDPRHRGGPGAPVDGSTGGRSRCSDIFVLTRTGTRGARDRRGAARGRRPARVLQGGGPLPDRRGARRSAPCSSAIDEPGRPRAPRWPRG